MSPAGAAVPVLCPLLIHEPLLRLTAVVLGGTWALPGTDRPHALLLLFFGVNSLSYVTLEAVWITADRGLAGDTSWLREPSRGRTQGAALPRACRIQSGKVNKTKN